MTNILDGKKLAEELFEEYKKEIEDLRKDINRSPRLAIILASEDRASHTYVNNKIKACKLLGIDTRLIYFGVTNGESLSENIKNPIDYYYTFDSQDLSLEQKIQEEIYKLNEDKSIDGILVQLPLPDKIDKNKIINSINPKKDVDGLHPFNFGKMAVGISGHKPATPMGILKLLNKYKVPTEGKNCVIIGRSRIAGQPLSILLSQNKYPGNCTVTLCHSKTPNIPEITKKADIVILALGKPHFLKSDMIKEGAVVIDIGINRIPDTSSKKGYKLVGDADFDDVYSKCSYITPVPNGVGPMTIASLMRNLIKAASYDFDGKPDTE